MRVRMMVMVSVRAHLSAFVLFILKVECHEDETCLCDDHEDGYGRIVAHTEKLQDC